MKLRDHPLMSFQGQHNWPPRWFSFPRITEHTASGEFGILDDAYPSATGTHRCDLKIHTEEHAYVGSLRFDNGDFCKQVCDLLQRNRGRAIKQIAELDVP